VSELLCKYCHAKQDWHGVLNEECLKYKDGEVVGFLGTTFVPELPARFHTKENLEKLVSHMQIYSGYKNHGYAKMSMEMKALYKFIEDKEYD
jgi:hypothetical protein